MESLIIADTDVVIDFFSGAEPAASAVSLLIESDRLALSSMTVFELYAGVTGKKRLDQVREFVSMVPVFPLNQEEARNAGQIYTELRKNGTLIGNQDILIAGVCVANHVPLMTRNTDHFSRVSGLELFDWRSYGKNE